MSKKAMTLVVAFAMIATLTASAESVDLMSTSLGKIDAAYARGEIDYDHAVTYKYLAGTTGAKKYVPASYLGIQYGPEMTSGTPAVIEIRAAWPYLSADCKEMVAEFHGWGVGETWGHTTWRPTYWGNTSYAGFQTATYSGPDSVFLIHWATAGEQQPNSQDYNSTENPHNQDPEPVPDMAYFSDVYYNVGYDTYMDHGWYDFSAQPDYEDWFPLRDYYADVDGDPDTEDPFPGGDYDYGGSDKWDVYIGQLGAGVGGVTYIDNAFPLTPWYAYSAYCLMPNGNYTDDWDWDNSFNLPEASVHEWMHATEYMYDALESSPTIETRWYLEASAMWGEMLTWPDPHPYTYTRDPIGRWDAYLNSSVVTLGGTGDEGGYRENIINFFFEDWSSRDWVAPDWTPPPTDPGFTGEPYAVNNSIVREMWKAASGPGDTFFDADGSDDTTDRNTYEAFDFILQRYNPGGKFRNDIPWPAWTDAYYVFSSWNWFVGAQHDGRYRYGAYCPADHSALTGNFTAGTYPVEDVGSARPMDFFSHAYVYYGDLSTDATVATWDKAVAAYYSRPDVDEETKYWMGGVYATTDGGSNWGNFAGTQGIIEPTFDVADYSIIQIDDPSQYDALSYLLVNYAEEGEDTFGFLVFKEVTETTPPVPSVSVIRPEINPDYLEILVGTDEDLFGVPKVVYDIDYADSETDDEYGVVTMYGNDANNRSFTGTYVMPIGSSGSGTLDYGVSDVNGNITTGQLNLDLGFVTGAGGVVGDDPAFVRIPSGAVTDPVHVSIVPLEGFVKSETSTDSSLNVTDTKDATNNLSENEVFGMAYDFGPYWADLKEEVYITLNYADHNVTREDYLSVYQYTANGWEDIGGVIDKSHKRVIAEADSFGIFALGYGEKKDTVGSPNAPKAYALYQNYPNPAADISIVKYALPKAAHASIKIYDIKGRIVDVLVDEHKAAGEYSLTVDTNSLADGIYLYRMETEDFSAAKKMVIAH